MAIAEFTVVPLDKGESVSKYVSSVLDLVDKSGLEYQFTPMATIVEGDLDDIFKLVRACHDKMRGQSRRVITTLKIDDREGATGRIKGKTGAVEKHLGRELRK
jgi:uncharacterized protein (TIGR00106 family)